jgi:hypothetical protein
VKYARISGSSGAGKAEPRPSTVRIDVMMCFAGALWLDSDTSIRSIRLASRRPRRRHASRDGFHKATTTPRVTVCSRLASIRPRRRHASRDGFHKAATTPRVTGCSITELETNASLHYSVSIGPKSPSSSDVGARRAKSSRSTWGVVRQAFLSLGRLSRSSRSC